MYKLFFAMILSCALNLCWGQVKIGFNPGSVNPAAILELSNNVAAAPNTWKSLLPPKVNFSHAAFTSNYVWGIAGSPTAGAIVYNTGESYSNGFSGPGLYCWHRNSWAPINIMVTDKIAMSLSTSSAAYSAAPVNTWVNITAAEYANLLLVVNGAARYGSAESYMNTSAGGGWSPGYTVGGSNNSTKVPASSYIIAWSVRTGTGVSSSLNSKLKISPAQNSGYSDYGSPLPLVANIPANTRTFFVLKAPFQVSPATPCYTAVFNAVTYFLGNNSNAGAGPEYYVAGDGDSPTVPFTSDSFSQVICTDTRQW